ncbi:MAG: hypothetical protein DRP26_02305, partial [Candidatus Zixiibacteriota bacterium]
PYWARGIDVACGAAGGGQAWYRYLIGSDGISKKLFGWRESDANWFVWDLLPTANRMISYRDPDGNGEKAFCTNYNDRVWQTSNGGWSWAPVPNSELIPNKQFATVEIDKYQPGSRCFVGCSGMENEASVYEGILSGGSWDWNPVGDSLTGLDVNDLEYNENWLVAATNDGIWRYNPWLAPEWDSVGGIFNGKDILAIDPIEHHNPMWAASGIIDDSCRLYYSWSVDTPWEEYAEVRVGNPAGPFNREANDIAAILIYSASYQSVYIATQEGLYLLDVVGGGEDYWVRTYIDFQASEDYPDAPFRYDFPVLSVDYYQESDEASTRYILVGTAHNVYLITETREDEDPHEIVSITFTDITEGTFPDSVTSLTYPRYTPDEIVLTHSPRGLIKKGDFESWQVKAISNSQHPTYTGTDIVADISGHVLAASSDEENGAAVTIFSSDFGETWEDPDQLQRSIRAVELNPHNYMAYAGGYANLIYTSTDDGRTWSDQIIIDRLACVNDILADPDPDREDIFYIAGSIIDGATVKVSAWNGSNWIHLDNGLANVTHVNQLCKNASDNALYAATDIGVFKADVSDLGITSWVRKTDDIGNPDFGSIVIDTEDLYVLFASISPDYPDPIIYVSADSGRSWIEYVAGQLGEDGASASKLSYAQRLFPAIVAGTDKGVYFLPDVVKSGQYYSDQSWGPGKVIINGDIQAERGVTLEIVKPCTVCFVYNFDYRHVGADPYRSEIIVFGEYIEAVLRALGTEQEHIVFTSSRNIGQQMGDWFGIVICAYGSVDLSYCDLEYAKEGIYGYYSSSPSNIQISSCSFNDMETAGIDLHRPSFCTSTGIKDSEFLNCGSYGIRVRRDDLPAYPSIEIKGNQITDCDYGIWYSGNGNESGSKQISICENIIRRTTQGQGNYGLYVTKYDPSGYSPIANIESDSINYFQQGGIYLNSVSSSSILMANKVKHNGSYGLYLSNSSPDVISDEGIPNVFTWSVAGIYCGTNGCPYVRSTKIKENSIYGVLIDPGAGVCVPDFGTINDEGGNSFYCSFADPFYDDMENAGPIVCVYAIGNWWGEVTPDARQIDGNIYYFPWLTRDPLPGYEKRASTYADIPDDFNLQQNFPNPFNPNTEISFYLPEQGFTDLKIYNLAGQLVKKLISKDLEAGEHTVVWDGKNAEGDNVSSGIYFYILSTGNKKIAKKMTLIR